MHAPDRFGPFFPSARAWTLPRRPPRAGPALIWRKATAARGGALPRLSHNGAMQLHYIANAGVRSSSERTLPVIDPSDGQIVIDKSQKFFGERGEWTNPDSFLKL